MRGIIPGLIDKELKVQTVEMNLNQQVWTNIYQDPTMPDTVLGAQRCSCEQN